MKALLFNSESSYHQDSTKPAMAITFLAIILFIYSIIYAIKFSQYYLKGTPSIRRLPPGPKPWPLIGCLPAMLSNKNLPAYQWIHEVMKQFNTEIACIRLGSNTHIIPVASPELSLEFLNTHDSVFGSRSISMTAEIVSNGYLSTVLSPMGEQWKKMRKILASQVLNSSTLHRMLGQRTDEADILLRYIFGLTKNGEAINIRSIVRHYCGTVIRRMIFSRRYYGKGREDGGPSLEEEEHNQALLSILRHVNAFSISEFIPLLKTFDLDGHGKIVKRALKVIRNHDEPIIEERVQEWGDGKKKKVEDILDILISLKNENGKSLLSIEEIKAQVTVIYDSFVFSFYHIL